MKCPKCDTETRHTGTGETLVGYPVFVDAQDREHHHNDNCEKRRYLCVSCGEVWVESIRRRCNIENCDWKGKTTCHCHAGNKVDEWTDPEDYLTPEMQALVNR